MVTKTENKEPAKVNKPSNYFEELSRVDCSGKTKKKKNLDYLSWAYAWGELKKRFPLSFYTIYENEQGYNYFTDGRTCWVKTGVTVVFNDATVMSDGLLDIKKTSLEHVEYLPVMDYKNDSIPVDKVTSFDINKAIQRSLTKAIARHGLGLSLYGFDFSDVEDDNDTEPAKASTEAKQTETAAPKKPNKVREDFVNFCKENDIKGEEFNTICKIYKLNNAAPDENFKNALDYAKGQVRKRTYAEALANEALGLGEYPEEV